MNNIPESVAAEVIAKGLNSPELLELISEVLKEISDAKVWLSKSTDELSATLYRAIVCYGSTNLESLVPFIFPVYQHFVDESEVSHRLELEGVIRSNVEQGRLSLNALLPFIYIDNNKSVVSTATIDLCMIGKPTAEDPLAWPRRIVNDLTAGMPVCKGGVLGGLLCLGDARVVELLLPLRDVFSVDDIPIAATCNASWASIASFEFWLDWAEALAQQGLTETGHFGDMMSALILLQRASNGRFLSVRRNFGYLFDESIQAPLEILAEYSYAEMRLKYGGRLMTLAKAESEPKLALEVLNGFL
jgi:hypothetical protein